MDLNDICRNGRLSDFYGCLNYNPNGFKEGLKKCDKYGLNPLLHAAKGGFPEMVEKILSLQPELVNHQDVNQMTALHHICHGITKTWFDPKNSDFYLVLTILLKTPDLKINLRDHFGRTPLFILVCWKPYYSMTSRLLLDAGADPSIPNNREQAPKDCVWYSVFLKKDYNPMLENRKPFPRKNSDQQDQDPGQQEKKKTS